MNFIIYLLIFCCRELVQLNTELEKQLSTVETLKLENKELVATIEQNKTKFDDQVKCLKLKFVENEDRLKHNLTDQDFKFNNKLKLAEEKCREDSLELENSLHKVRQLMNFLELLNNIFPQMYKR